MGGDEQPERRAVDHDVFAVRFAIDETTCSETFLRYGNYGKPDGTLLRAFYYWVVRGADEVVLFDCGFDQQVADRHGHGRVEPIGAGLEALSIAPGDVKLIVISHLHYDHVGNLAQFPNAEIAVQASEDEFWSSAMARRGLFSTLTEPEYMASLERARAEGRLRLLHGDTEVAGGIRALSLPGHTPGQQGLVVESAARPVVLASDALHFRAELDNDWPFMILSDLVGMYESFDKLRGLDDAGHLIVPGHGPEVAGDFEVVRYGSDGVIARLQ